MDQSGMLELKVAKEEKGTVCGGILRVDAGTRRLMFEGIKEDIGCKQTADAPFEDVDSVSTGDEAGFTIRFKKGKPKKLVLLPVLHARWFAEQWKVGVGGLATPMQHGPVNLTTAGGKAAPNGDAAGAAPSTKHVDLPRQVIADSKTAVERILRALGRERRTEPNDRGE